MLRFAVVTDIHYGFDHGNKKGSLAPALIDRFVRTANRNAVDFAVDMGDRVISKDAIQDLSYLQKIAAQFNQCAMPKYSVHGNHDLKHLSRAENAKTLGVPPESFSMDVKDFHAIFWSPHVDAYAPNGLALLPADLQWLENTLAATDKKCVLFNHIPLDNFPRDDAMAIQQDKSANRSYYENGAQARDIIRRSEKVILSMSGHRHVNRCRNINNTYYVTHQALVQRYGSSGYACEAFSIVTIKDSKIRIEGHGRRQPSRLMNFR